jgi:hypothetical protein
VLNELILEKAKLSVAAMFNGSLSVLDENGNCVQTLQLSKKPLKSCALMRYEGNSYLAAAGGLDGIVRFVGITAQRSRMET